MLSQTYISEEMQKQWFANVLQQDSAIYWVVWFKETPIGVTSLNAIDLNTGTAEPGMYIYPQEYRNNIVPFCVAFALNDFAFNELGLTCLIGKIFEDNSASLRFHEKTGYREISPEAIERESFVEGHEGKGLHWFTLVPSDYERAKAPIARFIRY